MVPPLLYLVGFRRQDLLHILLHSQGGDGPRRVALAIQLTLLRGRRNFLKGDPMGDAGGGQGERGQRSASACG